MPYDPAEYLIEEVKCIYKEIQERIQRVEDQLKFGLIASGAFWAWIAVKGKPEDWHFQITFIPVIVTLFLGLTWAVQDRAIRGAARYIRKVEKTFELPEGTGWITQANEYHSKGVVAATWGFWFVLFILNIVGVIFFNKVMAQ